jgi:hypothetical protein
MLSEIRNARQVQGEGFRRWFTDEYFDLIVWYGEDNSLIGFQLCYDKKDRERALTWTFDHGFQHNRIDSGEVPGHTKMSPVIIADGEFGVAEILGRFEKASARMDAGIASFVSAALNGYPRKPTADVPRRGGNTA